MSDLAAEADWLVITGDDRIRHNPAWRRAWIQMGHTTFFLLAAWMKAPGEAWRLLRWLPQILAHGLNERRGTGLLLPLRWHGGNFDASTRRGPDGPPYSAYRSTSTVFRTGRLEPAMPGLEQPLVFVPSSRGHYAINSAPAAAPTAPGLSCFRRHGPYMS